MGPARRKAAGRTFAHILDQGSDAELVGAVLEVYQHLELEQQFRVLLQRAMAWSGASLGFVFGPRADRRALVPLAGSVPEQHPLYRALKGVSREQLDTWLEGGSKQFQGLGALASLAQSWSEGVAETSLAFRLRPERGPTAGLLWLIFDGSSKPADTERIEKLLEMARPAIGNAVQVLAMRELVIKDDTASCYNRRHFEESLPEELSRASRFRAPLSLIFFDVDNLKQINNDHGHTMGSRTLHEVSVRVRGKIRKFDKLFRFGGDEFCIVLPETEWHGALEVAERVRESIAGSPFLSNETESGQGVWITASFGIASFPLHARAKEDLVEQADRAMQRIKTHSKNAVGVAEIGGDDDG